MLMRMFPPLRRRQTCAPIRANSVRLVAGEIEKVFHLAITAKQHKFIRVETSDFMPRLCERDAASVRRRRQPPDILRCSSVFPQDLFRNPHHMFDFQFLIKNGVPVLCDELSLNIASSDFFRRAKV
jgi:hypothetical protein